MFLGTLLYIHCHYTITSTKLSAYQRRYRSIKQKELKPPHWKTIAIEAAGMLNSPKRVTLSSDLGLLFLAWPLARLSLTKLWCAHTFVGNYSQKYRFGDDYVTVYIYR